jgi:hypothetical protein
MTDADMLSDSIGLLRIRSSTTPPQASCKLSLSADGVGLAEVYQRSCEAVLIVFTRRRQPSAEGYDRCAGVAATRDGSAQPVVNRAGRDVVALGAACHALAV